MLVWALLIVTMLGAVEAPQMAFGGIRLLGLYVLFRVMLSVHLLPGWACALLLAGGGQKCTA